MVDQIEQCTCVSLLTAMLGLRHSLVRDNFCFGIILPIPKIKHGDLSNIDMHRAIIHTPIVSKMFESELVAICRVTLCSLVLKDCSCSHALSSVSESVRYYNKRSSKFYCAFRWI